ncbi:MAG: hypothetical protein KF914_21060 [Rhizobiaceae bacterium]|nr:hypothetical protein [Rhizobiaceae bacterium]
MSGRGSYGLWLAATAGSIGLHGAIGITLYAMPMPEVRKPQPTEIRFETPDIGAAAALSPESQAPSIIARVAPAVATPPVPTPEAVPQATVVQPAARTETPPARPEPAVPREAASQLLDPSPVDALAPAQQASSAIEPSAAREAVAAVPVEALAPAAAAPSDVAAQAPETVLPGVAAAEEAAAAAEPDAVAALIAASEAVAPAADQTIAATIAAEAPRAVEPGLSDVVLPDATASGLALQARPETAVAASPQPSRSAPAIAPAAADPARLSAPPLVVSPGKVEAGVADNPAPRPVAAAPARPQAPSPAAQAVAGPASVAAAPLAVAAAPPPGGKAPPAAMVAAPVKPQAPSLAAQPAPRAVVTATEAPAGDQRVAMILQPTIDPDGESKDAARPGRLRIGDFLATREDEECLLAIPTSMGAQQASIEAFTIKPESVTRLGSDYEKESGLSLRADTKPVSANQCIALTFARSLAAYPNFPLRLTLNESMIRSGAVLSGVISGLRKSTLYLVVVDDEGKAELMDANLDVRSTITSFRAPMTLTSGPVSSVQLLVAIASDGPLETVPRRPGMPAEEYFSRLATEIVIGNRSIAYGITSFQVK